MPLILIGYLLIDKFFFFHKLNACSYLRQFYEINGNLQVEYEKTKIRLSFKKKIKDIS